MQQIITRRLGLWGLIATGVCSMIGASIYVVPFMIQRHVPEIGPYVIPAFLLAAIPAILAAMAYGVLSTAMPQAGGSYTYVRRGLHPYWGFAASFSQWFGLSIVIGVIAYVSIAFVSEVAAAASLHTLAYYLGTGLVRVVLALVLIWLFVWVNIRGVDTYTHTIIPMMVVMFALGMVVIMTGFSHSQADFLAKNPDINISSIPATFSFKALWGGAAILFASFIGFDSIAQAGAEAKNPTRNLPLSIILTILIVGTFYVLFTGAVYHSVPWRFIASQALTQDVTASSLMALLLSPFWTLVITAGAAIALINDLPAMLLSVSRLTFAWAADGIFPKSISRIHPVKNTPVHALYVSGAMASVGVLGSHFAGSYFLGIDIMVTAIMVNFLLVCLTLAMVDSSQPALAAQITFIRSATLRKLLGWSGCVVLVLFLLFHTWRDLTAITQEWYFKATPVWFIVMLMASCIFLIYPRLSTKNTDI